jgi:single-strand DNA-binding protein
MNEVIMIGRITKDIDMKQVGESAVCKFPIAVKKSFVKEGDIDAYFFNVVAWGKTAEFVNKYMGKGRQIAVVGELQNSTWTDAEGTPRYSTEIRANKIYFADSKKVDESSTADEPERTRSVPVKSKPKTTKQVEIDNSEISDEEEDDDTLPF